MVSSEINKESLQDFYDKLLGLCPLKPDSEYLQGCHFVLMHIKRLLRGQDPFMINVDGLSILLDSSHE